MLGVDTKTAESDFLSLIHIFKTSAFADTVRESSPRKSILTNSSISDSPNQPTITASDKSPASDKRTIRLELNEVFVNENTPFKKSK